MKKEASSSAVIDRISQIISIDNRDPDSTPRALFVCLSGKHISLGEQELVAQYEHTLEVLQNNVWHGAERSQAENEANMLYIAGGLFGGTVPDQLNSLNRMALIRANTAEPPMPENVVEASTQLINRASRLGYKP